MSVIALVVVTHNSLAWLDGLVRPWEASVARAQVAAEVIVADSGSRDGTAEALEHRWPQARVLRCGDVGFGAAANTGVKFATAPWVIVSNPDVAFAADFLATMHQAAANANPKTACLAPQLL